MVSLCSGYHTTGTVDVPLIHAKISVMGRDRTLHTYDLVDYNVNENI